MWKIGAHYYPIEIDPVDMIDRGNWGEHSARNRTLHIDQRDRPDSAVAEDLIHELLHALLLDSGVPISDKMEERVVSILAPRIAMFLEDNHPAAIRALAARCRPED